MMPKVMNPPKFPKSLKASRTAKTKEAKLPTPAMEMPGTSMNSTTRRINAKMIKKMIEEEAECY